MSTSDSLGFSGQRPVATGFDLEPLATGNLLIGFFGDDGVNFNAQVITRNALAQFPAVVHATFLAVDQGQDAALAFLNRLTAEGADPHCGKVGTTTLRSGGDR